MNDCVIPEFYQTYERVARKQYHCCECNAPILKGEKHLYIIGKWEGDISTHRQHLDCCEACETIRGDFNDGECVCFGGLFEFFGEMRRGFVPHDGQDDAWRNLRGLIAKIKWRERRRKP